MANGNMITLKVKANNGLFNETSCSETFDAANVRIGRTVYVYYDTADQTYKVYSPITGDEGYSLMELTLVYVKDRYLYCEETVDMIQALLNACCVPGVEVQREYEITLGFVEMTCELVNGFAIFVSINTNYALPINTNVQIRVTNNLDMPRTFTLHPHDSCSAVQINDDKLVVVSPSTLVIGCLFLILVPTGDCGKASFKISVASVTPGVVYTSNLLTHIYDPV